MRAKADEAEAKLKAMAPAMIERMPLTLEEIFLDEMEGMDYDFSKSSPRSDRRAFSPFLYTFSRAFSENFIFPLLNMLGIAIFTIILPVTEAIPNIQLVAAEEEKH